MAAMAPWMWFAGFGAMVFLAFVWPNPILILIVLLAAYETYRRWKHRKDGEEGNAEYYRVAPRHRFAVAAVYIGLIVVLALGMDATFVERTLRRRLIAEIRPRCGMSARRALARRRPPHRRFIPDAEHEPQRARPPR